MLLKNIIIKIFQYNSKKIEKKLFTISWKSWKRKKIVEN